ncbi:LysR family transcriptional regulator [Amycolatopsis sp. H20-H5]|uniref:LysR family transcriptional regulator n=1 Tax=Amycolatopsis sp. H20-H5 TaxID=3046309 RepID=UPI002DBC4752|nr:LysR family transcriptional regulator [Amycolatopsis sp. H20-H5]MEC3976605.1 LysR family transcriptional regulator [Amycolatopsis sp. H20-H5]
MLDPGQLRLLQVVARTGSYSAAARELGYTQPAITYQMHSLERSAGSTLAVRKGRSMRLTAAGELLLAHADRILAAVRGAENDLAALAGVPTGTVRLAAFPSSCASLVPSAMVSMRHGHPGVHIELVQAELPQAHEFVQRGEVDLALTYHFGQPRTDETVVDNNSLTRLPITVDDVHLILPADHPAAGRHELGIEELPGETWIVASPKFHGMLDAAAAPFGFTPRVMHVADDYVTMQSLVAHGFGVALVPNLALTAHRDSRVVPRSLRGWPQRQIEVECWPDMLRVDAVRVLIEHLEKAAGAST